MFTPRGEPKVIAQDAIIYPATHLRLVGFTTKRAVGESKPRNSALYDSKHPKKIAFRGARRASLTPSLNSVAARDNDLSGSEHRSGS